MHALFSEFPPISKAEWLAKIAQDLKGKPFSDLQFQLEENIRLDPFYHPEDFSEWYEPIVNKPDNNWQIGETIVVSDIKTSNAQALEALNGGANALLFFIKNNLSSEEFAQLLGGIELEYIAVCFKQLSSDQNSSELLHHFYNFIKSCNKNPAIINGCLNFNTLPDGTARPLSELAESLQFYKQEMPDFRLIEVDATAFHYSITGTVSTELAHTVAQANGYVADLSDHDIAPAITNHHLQFSLAIGTSYFVEIAKLRALKLLWANVLAAYQISIEMPLLEVHFTPASQDTNPNTNMIRAATQALAAVIGGADRLYVRDANAGANESDTPFTRRTARNVQHILQLESYMDKVVDPAAGSYYIEKLTDQLAEAAWEKFQVMTTK
jgi:methylmalonyl-CoA mutase